MNIEIIMSFMANILLLLGLAVVYSIFPIHSKMNEIIKRILMGLLVSFIGITVMSSPFELEPGLVFDARAVLLSISGMFFGFIPTIIPMIFMSIYRYFVIKGDGAFTGVLWIISSGILGLLWRQFRLKNSKMENVKITWIELYLFSILVQIVMIGLLLTLPNDRIYVLRSVSFALITVYPLGSLLIAQFLLIQRQRYFQNIKTVQSEIQYRNLFQKSNTIHFLLDAETGMIKDINETAIDKYGYTKEEFIKMNIKDINTLSHDEVQAEIDKARYKEKSYFQFKHQLKNGEIMDVEVHSSPVELDDQLYILTSIFDITEQVETDRLYRDVDEKLRATLLSVGEGIVVTDELARITLINDKATNLLGESKKLTRKKIYDVFRIYSSEDNISFKDAFNECITYKKAFRSNGTYNLITNDNDLKRFVDFTISPINIEEDQIHGAILVIRDITLEKANQDEIKFISHHDYLTNLYNRFFFEEQLRRLDTARQLPITIFLGDINGLKLLNDTFSHLEGDNLLIEVSKILKKATRSEDIVSR